MSILFTNDADINTLKPYPGNPRIHDLETLKESLQAHGQYKPIVVQASTDFVLAGNGTLQAALDLGWTTLLTTFVEVDDEEASKIVLVDNRANELGGYDDEALAKLLATLGPTSLDGTGYTPENLDALLAEVTAKIVREQRDLDYAPDQPEGDEVVTQVGDVIVLGKHRLVCGDALDDPTVFRLVGDEAADLVLTDPPYMVNYAADMGKGKAEFHRKDGLTVSQDNLVGDEADEFIASAMKAIESVLKPGGVFYCFCPPGPDIERFLSGMRGAGLQVREILLWIKDRFMFGRQDYHWRHEAMLYGWRDGAAHYFVADRTQDTLWDCPKPARSKDHPTMKPVDLLRRAVVNSSEVGDLVVDLFAGSGSTMAACIAEGRRCYMMELDPGYCDVIVARYESLTGEKVR